MEDNPAANVQVPPSSLSPNPTANYGCPPPPARPPHPPPSPPPTRQPTAVNYAVMQPDMQPDVQPGCAARCAASYAAIYAASLYAREHLFPVLATSGCLLFICAAGTPRTPWTGLTAPGLGQAGSTVDPGGTCRLRHHARRGAQLVAFVTVLRQPQGSSGTRRSGPPRCGAQPGAALRAGTRTGACAGPCRMTPPSPTSSTPSTSRTSR